MKKQILISAAALSSSVLLLTPLTAQAASCPTIKTYSNSQSNNISELINNAQSNSNGKCFIISNSNCQTNSNILSNSGVKGNNNIILSNNSCLSVLNGTISLPDFGDCVNGGITLSDYNCPTQDANSNVNDPIQTDVDLPNTNQPETSTPIIPDTNIPNVPVVNQPDTTTPESSKDNSDETLPEKDETVTPTEEKKETEDTDTNQTSYMKQVVSLVNVERAKYGLAPVTIDSSMEKAALVRSREIQTSFAHTRPDGSSFSTALKDAGVSYRQCGENIAWGQKTPEEVMNGWMNSSGHRANILNSSYTRIGVGYVQNASGTGYWVQLFAN